MLANGRRRELVDPDSGLITWSNFHDFLVGLNLDHIVGPTQTYRDIWKSIETHAGKDGFYQKQHLEKCGCGLRASNIGGSDYRFFAIEPLSLIKVFEDRDLFRIKVDPYGTKSNSVELVNHSAGKKQQSLTFGANPDYREALTKFCEALKLELDNPVITIDLL